MQHPAGWRGAQLAQRPQPQQHRYRHPAASATSARGASSEARTAQAAPSTQTPSAAAGALGECGLGCGAPAVTRCTSGQHAVCAECTAQWVEAELEEQRTERAWRPTLVRCAFHSSPCAGALDDDVVVVLPAETRRLYMDAVREAQAAATTAEHAVQREAMIRTLEQMERERPGIARDQLSAQMRAAFPQAVQCAQCGLGPVLHAGCSDLRAHHGSQGISNACQRCGWFSDNIRDWKPWDGTVSLEAVGRARGAFRS